jgi:hypothetical protein
MTGFSAEVRSRIADGAHTDFRAALAEPHLNTRSRHRDAPRQDSLHELLFSNNSSIRVGTSLRSGALSHPRSPRPSFPPNLWITRWITVWYFGGRQQQCGYRQIGHFLIRKPFLLQFQQLAL